MTPLVLLPQPSATLATLRGDRVVVSVAERVPDEWVGGRVVIGSTEDEPRAGAISSDWWVEWREGLPRRPWLCQMGGRAFRLPLGVVVGSATLDAQVPIVDRRKYRYEAKVATVNVTGKAWYFPSDGPRVDLTDDAALSDFTPGRTALVLSDVAAVDTRCPNPECRDGRITIVHCPSSDGWREHQPCPTCLFRRYARSVLASFV